MTATLGSRLDRGIERLGVNVSTEQHEALLSLIDKLVYWSKRVNLTSIREPAAIVDRHLLDSLALLPWLAGERIADIGTGAGFPGLPLAIVQPTSTFELIDTASRKIRFVVQVAAELDLTHVTGVHARLPGYAPAAPFTTVTARAYASLSRIVRDSEHILADGGRILAMKGRSPKDEAGRTRPVLARRVGPARRPGAQCRAPRRRPTEATLNE